MRAEPNGVAGIVAGLEAPFADEGRGRVSAGDEGEGGGVGGRGRGSWRLSERRDAEAEPE